MVRRYLQPSPNGQFLLFSFFFSSHSQSFVFPQPHLCFKPDLDVQNFTSPLGNQSQSPMPGPGRNGRHTHPDKRVGSWRVLSLGWLLAFIIMTRPGGSNKATQQSRQKLLQPLNPHFPGTHTAPCFRHAASAQPWKSGKESRKGKTRKLQTGAEQEKTSEGFSRISVPYPIPVSLK